MMMGGGPAAHGLRQETSKPKNTAQTLGRLWSYFKHYWYLLLGVLVAVLLTSYIQVLTPDLTGQAVDCFITPATLKALAGNATSVLPGPTGGAGGLGQAGAPVGAGVAATLKSNCWFAKLDPAKATTSDYIAGLGRLVLLIAGLYVVGSLLNGLMFYLMSYAGQHVLRNMRVEVFKHIHRLSLGYFTRHEAGDVMTRITADADTLQQAISFPLVSVVQGVVIIVWVAATMLSQSVAYALVALAMVPFMFVATLWFSSQARKAFRNVRSSIGTVNASLQESLAGVREVQAFTREDENIRDFNQSSAAAREASIRAASYTSALGPSLQALGYISLALVAGVGGSVILSGGTLAGTTISLGLVIAFIQYSQRFNQPIQQISVMWTNIQSAIAGAERIFGLLDTPPEITDKPDAIEMPPIKGRVEFNHVYSEYEPGELVLKDVSLVAEPGQTVAIVGPTGAGKTTIINLIPRFYDVLKGSVTIDSIDVRDVTAASLRKQIGIVLQDSFLFSDTVLNNIRYGRPDATDEEVFAAARLARADQFIERLPQGYNTMLGERGSGLSQGQRQLISIARAALANPRILILDEATSSVDTRTERLIQKALEDLLKGRTSFVIAHRLSTIRNADQVLVLKDGEIIERGTHDSLMKQRGFYYKLYMSQFQVQEALGIDGDGREPAEEADKTVVGSK